MQDMNTCHCAADMGGSDHCPECFCEQFERYCDFAFQFGDAEPQESEG